MFRTSAMAVVAFALLACSHRAAGRVWLESARDVKPGNQLLKNPGLEELAAGKFADWSGWQAGYEVDTAVAHTGKHSARCTADPQGEQHGIYQVVTLNQDTPRPILARCWSKAENVSGSPDSNYSLYLDIEYMDGTPLWGQTWAFQTGTHDWQQGVVLVVPEKPIRRVNIHGIFRGHTGTAWFDDFEFYEMTEGALFDFLPAIGEIPALGGMEKLSAAGLALYLDPATGAMSLDGRRAGGIVVRDAAADSAFILPELSVNREGQTVSLSGSIRDLELELTATVKLGDNAIRLDGTVKDTSGKDRAVTVYWALPVSVGSWVFCRDPRRAEPCDDRSTHANVTRLGVGANGLASLYPFAPIVGLNAGVAIGAPIRKPRLCRFGFDAGHQVIYGAFDLGLSPETRSFPSAASFHAILFSFDPAWRFRSALRRYYELNGDAFNCRVPKQGIWMPFTDIARVEGWEDFGCQFQEGAPNPAFDEQHGIYSFPYIEPMSYWMSMPKEMPRTEEAALELLRSQALEGDRRAIATLSSALHTADGRMYLSFHDVPWCNGGLFLLNPDPSIVPPKEAPVTQWMLFEQVVNRIARDEAAGSESALWNSYGKGYQLVDGAGYGGSRCAKVSRDPGEEEAGLSQYVALNQTKPTPIIARAWSKAERVTGEKDSDYSLYIDLTYTDGTPLWGQVASFDPGTHDWQPVEVRIVPEKPVASFTLYLLLRGDHYGTAWFDNVSVKEEGSDKELIRGGDFERKEPEVRSRLDGQYIDSLEMACTTPNYRREHFAFADIPLVFDAGGRVCQLGHFLVMEMIDRMEQMLRPHGKWLFANAVLYRFPWPAGWLDIFGTETNWNYRGNYAPTSDATMLYWRAMCYKRPYLTLQNTDFDKFPPELVRKYFERCCYYGVLPSMFSPEASSSSSYWVRPDLYNRDRPLFKKYIPVIRRIAEAGWEPTTYATTNREDIWVERFGGGKEVYFTIFNDNREKAQTASITIELPRVLSGPVAQTELLLPEPRPLRLEGNEFTLKLEPEQVAVIRLASR
ncbi:MAG: hypothetical protein H5T86_07760 [Armatimonadetes bacterium]|nr:hypothetical protein [Armatimonadota bacterium]